MSASVTFACLLSLQQLSVEPRQVEVGEEVVVTVAHDGKGVGDVAIMLQLPDGERREAGRSNENGNLRLRTEHIGAHALIVEVDGVRHLVPFAVTPVRRSWLLALGSVPVGLCLLWLQLRRGRGARGARNHASTRST